MCELGVLLLARSRPWPPGRPATPRAGAGPRGRSARARRTAGTGCASPTPRSRRRSGTAARTNSTPVASRLPSGTPACGHEDQKPRRFVVAVLGGHQHRAAPLAADGEALQQPADQQQDRRRDADGGVRRQQADRERRDAHHHQRDDEHLLAADPVTEVAEDHAAEGPGDEAERVGAEGEQRRGDRLGLGEEQRAEDEGGGRAVEEEVVPLDGGADQAGEDDLDDARLRRSAGGRSGGRAWLGRSCVVPFVGGDGGAAVRRRSSRRP